MSQSLIQQIEKLKAENKKLKAENKKLKEAISYLPKIPGEPYEKMLARECNKLTRQRDALKKACERVLIEKFKRQNEIMKKALEFLASNNEQFIDMDGEIRYKPTLDSRIAREALKECESVE